MFAFSVLAAAGVFGHPSTFWALAAAISEGYQYISSRAIVESIFDFKLNFLEHPSAMAAILLKDVVAFYGLHDKPRLFFRYFYKNYINLYDL